MPGQERSTAQHDALQRKTTKVYQKLLRLIVKDQLRTNDPPETKQTFDRLRYEGCSKREAQWLIGCVVALEYDEYNAGQRNVFNSDSIIVNPVRFIANLHQLPNLPFWSEDELYQQTWTAVDTPDPSLRPRWGRLGLAGTMALFVLSDILVRGAFQLTELVLLVAILLFHEMGHYVGMRLFDYRDVRMFFLPFFGAAVLGRKHAAPVWQQAIVLLLGPLPGLILAGLLYLLCRSTEIEQPLLINACFMLLIINGFNLLPLVPLDGGRLCDVLLFGRHPMLTRGFLLFAVTGFLLLAFFVALDVGIRSWFFWTLVFLGLGTLLTLPSRSRIAHQQAAARQHVSALPERLAELTEAQRRHLFYWARTLERVVLHPTTLASRIKLIHEWKITRPPSLGVTVGMLLMYVFGGVGTALLLPQLRALEQEILAWPSSHRNVRPDIGESLHEFGRPARWYATHMDLGNDFSAVAGPSRYEDKNNQDWDYYRIEIWKEECRFYVFFSIEVQAPECRFHVFFTREFRMDQIPEELVNKKVQDITLFDADSRTVMFDLINSTHTYTLPDR